MAGNGNTSQTSFRDRPINIDSSGKRKWIFARKPKGKWYTRRMIVYWSLLIFLIAAPFISLKDHPFMLLDIFNRRFFVFGVHIWTQDTYILAVVMAVVVVSIVLFTVAFGRVFCGWACPQTLFLEGIFRRIEYLFDGTYRSGNRHSPSAIRTSLKHIVFYCVAVFFGNVFLMWIIGPDEVAAIWKKPGTHVSAFLFILFVSTLYYWIYAHFREQVCTMICPYGRMQGVLLDSKSISVIYDFKRGEPRGAKSKGDCIDCKSCLAVCPTGIDIRNGTQLECTNCTACIDECNIVMGKVGKPGNLIRYDSVSGIETGKRSLLNGRTIGYSIVLVILFSFMVVTLLTRSLIDVTMLRMSGTLYQQVDDETVSNIYSVKLINKSNTPHELDIRLKGIEGSVEIAGQKPTLAANEQLDGVIIIKVKNDQLSGKSTPVELGFYEGEILMKTQKINFLGPEK